jgi:hypothetical protein
MRSMKRHAPTQPQDQSYRLIPLPQGKNAVVDARGAVVITYNRKRAETKWAAKFERLLAQLEQMRPAPGDLWCVARLWTQVHDVRRVWQALQHGAVCGNPRCFEPALPPPALYCSDACANAVRAPRFRDRRKAGAGARAL